MLYALISPAKRLDFKPQPGIKTTQPALLKDTAILAERTRALSKTQIQKLMEISPALAQLNYDRYQTFDPANKIETKAAIYTFAGDVYMGLVAKTMSKEDVAYAQDHLGILSGLYGLLRPLDAIQAYRLEMGSELKNVRGKNLHAFWRERLTEHLNAMVGKLKNPTIVNLASAEYFGAVDASALKAPVIAANFVEIKNGKVSAPTFFLKKARGMMARAIVENRWEKPEQMKAFDTAGYEYDEKRSTDQMMVFSRSAPKVGVTARF